LRLENDSAGAEIGDVERRGWRPPNANGIDPVRAQVPAVVVESDAGDVRDTEPAA
jgi:hypothetical protein